MLSRTVSAITAALFVAFVASCGSDPATTSSSSSSSSETRQTEPSTSTRVTSSSSSTIAPVPSTDHSVSVARWSSVAEESLPAKAFPPCCADTWHGEVSPPLAPEGQPLADGPYAVDLQWPQDLTQPLELDLHRFEQCALLPEFSCEEQGGEFGPDELGIDTSVSRPLTVVLNDTVEVVVVGWNDAAVDAPFDIRSGTGTGLAALATEVEVAYAEVFADRFVAGESPEAIIADVRANPTSGFDPSEGGGMNSFVFTPQNGPPLLVQMPFPSADDRRTAGRGTDVLAVRSIEVADGQVTLYVYSAYYP